MMGDLISREALLVALDYGRTHNAGVRQIVSEAPTVAAAPVVHARWVMRPYYDDGDPEGGGEMVCSNCGERAPIHLDEEQYETPYCKDCGARMDADAPERGEGSGT